MTVLVLLSLSLRKGFGLAPFQNWKTVICFPCIKTLFFFFFMVWLLYSSKSTANVVWMTWNSWMVIVKKVLQLYFVQEGMIKLITNFDSVFGCGRKCVLSLSSQVCRITTHDCCDLSSGFFLPEWLRISRNGLLYL